MSYDVDYAKHKTIEDKQAAAIKDVQAYLGNEEHFDRVLCTITKACYRLWTYNEVCFAMGFAGIQGYPVQALIYYVRALLHEDEFLPRDTPEHTLD